MTRAEILAQRAEDESRTAVLLERARDVLTRTEEAEAA